MPQPVLDVHPDAGAEAEAGVLWYRERSTKVAERFLAELERAVDLIIETPRRWPKYLHGTRRYVLLKFPYSIIYRPSEARITICAVAHAKRRPGYWKERLEQDEPPVD
jgi:plasmid stabilization system protein ParE